MCVFCVSIFFVNNVHGVALLPFMVSSHHILALCHYVSSPGYSAFNSAGSHVQVN